MQDSNNPIFSQIEETRKALLHHELYSAIKTDEDLRMFMSSHVFAVWDFMSLLKFLQNSLTCTTVPWQPKGDADLRYLINEIVLAEETDLNQQGKRLSHYEMYLDAMRAVGMSTDSTKDDIRALAGSNDILKKLETAELPKHVKQFLQFTFSVINRGKDHEVAAAFTYGREDLIPEMFTELLKGLSTTTMGIDLAPITCYFDRHIELDGDEHGPMAHKMVALLCGNDPAKWEEAAIVSRKSLESRIELFNGILSNIKQRNTVIAS
jgi:hypothetical protein